MSKNLKNAILFSLIVISIIMIGLTFNYAKNHITPNSNQENVMTNQMGGKGQFGNIPDGEMDNFGKGGMKGDINGIDVPDEVKENFGKGGMKGPIDGENLPDIDGLPDGGIGNFGGKEIQEGEFKIDGGFGGAGELTAASEIRFTSTYIIFIGFWCLILSLSTLYLIMSKLNSKKVFNNPDKIVIYILINIMITAILTFTLTYLGNKYYLNDNKNNSGIEYSSTDDLHINTENWSYDSENNVYYQIGLVYVSNPATVEYESLGIYVPGDYMDCIKGSNDKYTCSLNTEAKIGDYTSLTAPIVMPMNTGGYAAQASPVSYSYTGLSEYLDAGFIYVYTGCRGKENGDNYDGGAPWGVTDFKAAIRYLRYNKNLLPGNTDSIFVFGMSGGGAQSTLVGTTGDSDLYTPYLESIGALMKDEEGKELSDAVAGIMAWCPITSLDYASEAYEWNIGQFMTTGTRASSTWTSALSLDMAEAYAKYINALKLIDENGNTLKLNSTTNGIYTSGTYYDYLLGIIEESLNNYLTDNYSTVSDMEKYIATLNSDTNWVTFDSNTKTVTISSIKDFVTHCKKASKDVGAFDDLNRTQAENYVFGNSESDSLHFDFTMASLLKENTSKYAEYSDYNSKYADEYNKDIDNVDSLGNNSLYRQNMYNPMYYLLDYYDGYETSNVAKYWRIRTGITQGDTALNVETNLMLALNQFKSVESVDFATVWNQGHTTAERTGNSTTNFINWVHECLK